jgi:glycyl-tRNA synthetase (class II)
MKCPVCKNREHIGIDLHVRGFTENIVECKICGSIWSINHGVTEIVKDTQKNSFLEALSECVDGDDYNWVGA